MRRAAHGDAVGRSLSGRTDAPPPSGRLFWLSAGIGAALAAVGVGGLLRTQELERIFSWATWFVGAIVVHDALLAPAACALGWVVARRAPPLARPVLQAALIVSATVSLATAPVWLEAGRARVPDNHTVLPDDSYLANLALVLAAIWLAALVTIAWRVLRRRSAAPG
jgi:hypothetical protein